MVKIQHCTTCRNSVDNFGFSTDFFVKLLFSGFERISGLFYLGRQAKCNRKWVSVNLTRFLWQNDWFVDISLQRREPIHAVQVFGRKVSEKSGKIQRIKQEYNTWVAKKIFSFFFLRPSLCVRVYRLLPYGLVCCLSLLIFLHVFCLCISGTNGDSYFPVLFFVIENCHRCSLLQAWTWSSPRQWPSFGTNWTQSFAIQIARTFVVARQGKSIFSRKPSPVPVFWIAFKWWS